MTERINLTRWENLVAINVLFHLSLATDPTKSTKRKATDDFQISSDGKLIIPDDEDEREEQEPGSKRKRKPGTCSILWNVFRKDITRVNV